MRLSAPTKPVFIISLVLAILALLGLFVTLPFVSAYAVWVALIAYLVLAIGVLMTGV